MINFNGTLQDADASFSIENRGYKYGDALFETLKVVNGKILFWEDHYFRLMASMRILRMEIPMNFTMEFLENEILKTIRSNSFGNDSARIRMNVHRTDGGRYLPKENLVGFNIIAEQLESELYTLADNAYKVELYKDYYIAPGLLSTLKTNNKIINVLGSIFAKENGFESCLLLNTEKNVVESLNGNLFMIKDQTIKTPPLEDGCLKGIMRKQIIEIVGEMGDFELSETSISPFELQKADELFVSNVIIGIQSITSYRKKEYTSKVAMRILEALNIKIQL